MKRINPQHAIELKHIIKNYVVHHEKPTLMETLFNGKNQRFTALKGIDLTIKKGERVGIIGPNGSGKTTLLKIIAGIASPTSGEVLTDGKVVSLIDLEAGFHPDLTGIQNIFLNGVLLGMSKKEIANNMESIINFANIGKFIDAQLFTYSEGMKLRLGFSVAIHSNPDILILDENISVGDQEFRKASFKKVKELFKKGKTVVIVSHNMDFISKNCQRVIWLEKGKIIDDSKSKNVISKYTHS